ncbi:hemicentin-1-like [Protopterus annectens]|uniref:hemicentin-1-like n=1 Tax=Protopterus annectens TaxID=7888 RepID=UPI001CFBB966|nr:hemicentin-1-like [Protopterus annectens]
MKSSKLFIWECCFIVLLRFNLGKDIENVKYVVGNEVSLNCPPVQVDVERIISVIWKINCASGTSCTVALTAYNNTTSNGCRNKHITTEHTAYLLHVPYAELNDSGLYTCEVAHASGLTVKVYNLTITEYT